MLNYSTASSGYDDIPQQTNNYPTYSIAVSVDTSPLETQIPESTRSCTDYAADYTFEGNNTPYIDRSSPLIPHPAETPAILHPFQYSQGLSGGNTAGSYNNGTFASQTHQCTTQVDRPEPYAVLSESIDNNSLNATLTMPFKIIREQSNGEEQYFCIDQSTGKRRGPVDISDVVQYPLGPSINYQIGVHRYVVFKYIGPRMG